MWALYVGGGDTLATTMRWLCCILAAYPDIQKRCFEELEKCYSENGQFVSEQCPFFNAVLLENFRFRPVGDSLLHKCIQDTEVGGYLIKKGTLVKEKVILDKRLDSNCSNPESNSDPLQGFITISYVQSNRFSRARSLQTGTIFC